MSKRVPNVLKRVPFDYIICVTRTNENDQCHHAYTSLYSGCYVRSDERPHRQDTKYGPTAK